MKNSSRYGMSRNELLQIRRYEYDELHEEITKLTRQRDMLLSALELIAAPVRADGTYNRCREACGVLAREAIGEGE